jgi:XTP/dITP diphosphohydrolase
MAAMRRVVFASNNAGKVREVAAMLAPLGVELVPQSFYYVPPAEETGLTFVENAIIKARNASRHTSLPAIADDSGLEVDGLDGEPGVRSARYAGEDADDDANNRRLVEELADVPETARSARFQCAMVYLRSADDATPLIAQGTWHGRVIEEPRGGNGFGYDPHFFIPELARTAAELSAAEKNLISHRALALQALMAQLNGRD